MALLIVDKNIDLSNNPQAKRLYLDALTTEGTLLLLDFSRSACVPNGLVKGSKVTDLAKWGSELNNDVEFKVTSNLNQSFQYVQDGSYLMRNTSLTSGENTSIDLGQSIQNYLVDNNVTNAVFVFWLFQEPSPFNGAPVIQSTTSQDIGTKNLIRLLPQTNGNAVFTINGVATNAISISGTTGKHQQIAIEYKLGQQLKVYKNTVLNSSSAGYSEAWGTPNSTLKIGQTSGADANVSTYKLGRILIEDLDASGRNALDVIRQDYNYVNAINEYQGIEKRPYANL